jgi:hypothetical protein
LCALREGQAVEPSPGLTGLGWESRVTAAPRQGKRSGALTWLRSLAAAGRAAAGVRREQGLEAADELIEGLVLLREQGSRAACYWLCPVCEQKFHSSRDFLGHVELVHEGLAVQVRGARGLGRRGGTARGSLGWARDASYSRRPDIHIDRYIDV